MIYVKWMVAGRQHGLVGLERAHRADGADGAHAHGQSAFLFTLDTGVQEKGRRLSHRANFFSWVSVVGVSG